MASDRITYIRYTLQDIVYLGTAVINCLDKLCILIICKTSCPFALSTRTCQIRFHHNVREHKKLDREIQAYIV